MKRKILLTAIALLVAITVSWAQDVPWNKDAYPDYDPVPHIDQTWVKQAKAGCVSKRPRGSRVQTIGTTPSPRLFLR